MKKSEDKLKKYICTIPFMHMEIHQERSYLCCPSWLPHPIFHNDREIKEVWNDELAQKIRQSILDGEYEYCSKTFCPSLNELINTEGPPPLFSNFVKKEKFPHEINHWDIKNYVVENTPIISKTPGELNFTFDRSCNLKCPSCRSSQYMANQDEVERINDILDYIEQNFSENVKKIFITGSGDPFASKSFRRFLKNFDKEKFKNLNILHLSTNGNLFDEKMWDEIKNSRDYIKYCEISIDAATKYTYENVTRLNGDWDKLMNNLKFIISLDSITCLRFSFVVQNKNYKEIIPFIELIYELNKERIRKFGEWSSVIYFSKVDDWYVMPPQEFDEYAVWKDSHQNYNEFLEEIKKIKNYKNKITIQTNFNELI